MHSDTCQELGVQEHSDIKIEELTLQEVPNNQQLCRGLWTNERPLFISARGGKGHINEDPSVRQFLGSGGHGLGNSEGYQQPEENVSD